ncbi:haloacid dehalogenase-like hydrolase [Beauveria bassiana ARSEF 2860]|uniref:Haloacid dehalogenase-like hydrolase n=1 Tax=Beauveria bassiana (strain ARSEF 2860) TaxID=655819 RepID=J5JFQ9_BEAB2|nr:haloacid dehalogenase-like hydrolase [Beauveria bassiana ARSEF 2860]EJP62451.1 haloacid dehalogenase-like hydrolase [Beauveria bassiana ARSEF 2860]
MVSRPPPAPVVVPFEALLFDLDGTLIDSTNAVVQHWQRIGKELGIDPNVILQTAHGRRTFDTLKIICPEKATMEYATEIEKSIPENHGSDATVIPGAREMLDSVTAAGLPWAIVTSASLPLLNGWVRVLDLPACPHLVTAESVEDGKPDPAGYLLGMKKLAAMMMDKSPAGCCVVFEDSPAGIRAAKTAGCKVVALATSHTAEQVAEAEPDWIVDDFRSVALVQLNGGGKALQISDYILLETPSYTAVA